MTYEKHRYYDPANSIKFERERDCRGCKHLDYVFSEKVCAVKPNILGKNLKKCDKYAEAE